MLFKSTKTLPILAGVLVAQLGLAALLLSGEDRNRAPLDQPLLAFEPQSVDRVSIASAEESLELRRVNDVWQLANGLPAESHRVERMLENLHGLKSGWPLANTAAAAERFEVSENNFQRKMQLYQGERKLGGVWIGTSPTFRRVHMRSFADANIYSQQFDIYEAGTSPDNWLDTTLLRPKGELISLHLGEHQLRQRDGTWPELSLHEAESAQTEQVAEDEQADALAESEASRFDSAAFVRTLNELRVLGVAQDASVFDRADDTKIVFEVHTDQGQYKYWLFSHGDQYFIRRQDWDHTFRMSLIQYEFLAKIQLLPELLASS